MAVIYLLSLEGWAMGMGGNTRCLARGYESLLLAVQLQAADTFTDLSLNKASLGLEAERGSDFPLQGRAQRSERSGQGTVVSGRRRGGVQGRGGVQFDLISAP